MSPAEGFRGKPEFRSECIGCGACAAVCPSAAIIQSDDRELKMRAFELKLDRCIFCGLCVESCPVKTGIVQTREFDLAVFDRDELVQKIERELMLCEVCGEIISTREHLRWVADHLGGLAYAHPALMLAGLGERGLTEREEFAVDQNDLTRADRMAITCPRCRHLLSLKG